MAQLRQDYQKFTQRQAEVVVVGPDDGHAFASYWEKEKMPFVGLADPEHRVADLFGQEVKLLRFGRMPALMLIDLQGVVRYVHYGGSMQDIPSNGEVLMALDELNLIPA